jgi:toxin ParE1/3/4
MAKLTFAPAADTDVAEIAAFIARDNPSASRRWVQVVRERCLLLAASPDVGEVRRGFGVAGCRSVSLGNYVIFFRATDDGVEIARIVHGSRDLRNL